ncbi:MAG TPA: YitT family protein [Lactobacillaceae bacterium]|jgi:uncharacterized membrane-anchored protein YitT (DUF2179 family)
MDNLEKIRLRDFLVFTIGTAMYGWGLVNVNIPNHLAEGGLSGITLILRATLGLNPAYTTLLLNIPLMIIGYKILGRKSFVYTVYGVVALSAWIWVWQHFPTPPNLHNDLLISGLLAGAVAGTGSGLIYRFGGTTGGSDIVARIFEQKLSVPMGKTLFALDFIVLVASLIYVDLRQMMYTLIAAFIFAQVVNLIQQGAYSARVFMIFTQYPEEISHAIMEQLERGTSLLKAEGGYTHRDQLVVYAVVDPTEVNVVRQIIHQVDPKAFVSISTAQEQLGEGFSYLRPQTGFWKIFSSKKNA